VQQWVDPLEIVRRMGNKKYPVRCAGELFTTLAVVYKLQAFYVRPKSPCHRINVDFHLSHATTICSLEDHLMPRGFHIPR
jgi:hypothetical protein